MRQSVWIRSMAPSFLSALIAIIPGIVLIVYGLSVLPQSGHATPEQIEMSQAVDEVNIDAGFGRSLIIIVLAIPSAYLILVTGLYIVGSMLVTIGVQRKAWFLLVANTIAVGVPFGVFRHVLVDDDATMSLYAILFLVASMLPATWCWWATAVATKGKLTQFTEKNEA